MIERIVRTNDAEASKILNGEKTYFVRSDKEVYKIGYAIRFQNYKQAKPVYHPISKVKYVVSNVDNFQTAPVERGYQLISVRASK
jgi:hypothetical protein